MIVKIDKAKYELHKAAGTLDRLKGDLVGELLGKRYSINDQVGLLRKKGIKPEEYAEFNAYADECVSAVNDAFAEMEKML